MEERKYCVYKHTNKFNGKIYIGLTGMKPEERWGNELRYSKHLSDEIKRKISEAHRRLRN